jgi:mRNA-degrading endonuclease RelE of RelBE toxin-antitoxin system
MGASYRVRLHPDARSDLASLDKGLQRRAGRQLSKLEGHPHAGEPLGHKAGYDLTGDESHKLVSPKVSQKRITRQVVG